MPKTARLGDLNSAGGPIVNNVSGDVFINGKPAAFVGSVIAPHKPFKPPHKPTSTIVQGSESVFVNGKKLAYVGSATSCGHPIATGSENVFVGLGEMASAGAAMDPYESPQAQQLVQQNGPAAIGLDQPPDTPAAPAVVPDTIECNKFGNNLVDEDYRRKISNTYTLADLSIAARAGKHYVQAQHGLSVPQICCNLSALAMEIIEPLRVQYPGFNINSGFRQQKNGSDHEKGMACDIQWPGISQEQLVQRCQWVVDHLQFWQIIYEKPPTSTFGWMHVAYNNGKRISNKPPVLTWFGSNYLQGLLLRA